MTKDAILTKAHSKEPTCEVNFLYRNTRKLSMRELLPEVFRRPQWCCFRYCGIPCKAPRIIAMAKTSMTYSAFTLIKIFSLYDAGRTAFVVIKKQSKFIMCVFSSSVEYSVNVTAYTL